MADLCKDGYKYFHSHSEWFEITSEFLKSQHSEGNTMLIKNIIWCFDESAWRTIMWSMNKNNFICRKSGVVTWATSCSIWHTASSAPRCCSRWYHNHCSVAKPSATIVTSRLWNYIRIRGSVRLRAISSILWEMLNLDAALAQVSPFDIFLLKLSITFHLSRIP